MLKDDGGTLEATARELGMEPDDFARALTAAPPEKLALAAREFGCSPAELSAWIKTKVDEHRASAPKVSPKMSSALASAAEQLGLQPDALARDLEDKTTKTTADVTDGRSDEQLRAEAYASAARQLGLKVEDLDR